MRTDIDIELFRTELREVMGILQRADDKEAMRRFFDENRQAFSRMTERGFEVIICLSLIHISPPAPSPFL